MAARNIFTRGNLPEDLSAQAAAGIHNEQPNWFFARIVALLAATLEHFRGRDPIEKVAADAKLDASANAAATLTFDAGGAGVKHAITGVAVSYSGAATGGKVQVKDDTTVVFEVDITAAGPTVIAFPRPIKGTANKAMSVVLAAGGAGVTGKVNALNHFTTT